MRRSITGLSIGFFLALAGSTSAQSIEKLSGSLAHVGGTAGGDVQSFLVSPDSAWAVYVADGDVDEQLELFSVPFDGSAAPRKVSRIVPPGGTVFVSAISQASDRVLYVTDQAVKNRFELFSAPIDGSVTPVRLSAAMPSFADVAWDFEIAPLGGLAVFRADSTVDFTFELFSVPLDGSAAPIKLNPALVSGGSVGNQGGPYSSFFAVAPLGDRVVYLADQVVDDRIELFSVPIDGSAPAVKLNGTLPVGAGVYEFHLTPDGSHVLYLADEQHLGRVDLYSVPIDGSAPTIRISGIPVAGGDVFLNSVEISPASDRAIYIADQLTNGKKELFSAPIDGSSPSVRLNAPLAGAGLVVNARISLDGLRATYIADEEPFDFFELFSAPIDGSASAVRLNADLPAGGDVEQWIGLAPGRVIYRADQNVDNVIELFSVAIDGSQPPVALSGTHVGVTQAVVSPDGSHALFVAAQELWLAPTDGSSGPVRMNVPFGLGSRVTTAPEPTFSPDGRAAYVADAKVFDQFSLWSADGAHTPIELSTGMPIPPTVGDVSEFAWAPDGQHVFYVADRFFDQETIITDVTLSNRAESIFAGGSYIHGMFFPPHSNRFAYRTVYLSTSFPYDSGETLWCAPLDGSGPPVTIAGATDIGVPLFTGDGRACFVSSYSGYRIDPTESLYVAPLDGSTPALELSPPAVAYNFVGPVTLALHDGRVVFGWYGDLLDLRSAPLDGSADSIEIDAPAQPQAQSSGLAVRSTDDRVIFVNDQTVDELYELWTVPADGSALPVRLNPPLAAGGDVNGAFRLSPDGTRAVYRADQDTDDVFELYSVPVAGGASVKLSGPMVSGGGVSPSTQGVPEFQISPDGKRVVYRADQDLDEVFELYSAPIDGSSPAVKLNLSLAGNRDVELQGARITPDSKIVVFAAEQIADLRTELFAVSIDGSVGPIRLSAPMPAGGSLSTSVSVGVRDTLALAQGGRHAYYLADQEVNDRFELYRVAVDGSEPPMKMNAPLTTNRNVTAFAVSPGGDQVLYLADQDEDEVYELYLSSLQRAPHPSGSAASTPTSTVTRTVHNP